MWTNSLTASIDPEFSAQWSAIDMTAIGGSDYIASSGTTGFVKQTSNTTYITILIIDDGVSKSWNLINI